MKGIRRIFMGLFGLGGWFCLCILIYAAAAKEGKIIVAFNNYGEMAFEIVLFSILLIFFIICVFLEFVDFNKNIITIKKKKYKS